MIKIVNQEMRESERDGVKIVIWKSNLFRRTNDGNQVYFPVVNIVMMDEYAAFDDQSKRESVHSYR